MKYIKLGNTGLDVSKICLGMMSFGKPGKENGVFPWAKTLEDGKPIFKKAIELGINYFDTANVYQMGICREIKQNHAYDHIPVMLFSALLKEKEAMGGCEADAYIENRF